LKADILIGLSASVIDSSRPPRYVAPLPHSVCELRKTVAGRSKHESVPSGARSRGPNRSHKGRTDAPVRPAREDERPSFRCRAETVASFHRDFGGLPETQSNNNLD